jgi:uroporphyrinogen decarboxylase
MNALERFTNCMHFKDVDRVPYKWWGAWRTTLERWWEEGLPRDVYLESYFGFDRQETLPINTGMVPTFDRISISEDDDSRTLIDDRGVRVRELKERTETSMPQFLEFPIKERRDFLEMRRRYDPESPVRFPQWWDEDVLLLKERKHPISLYGGRDMGFFGPVRGWTGLKRLLVFFHTDPGLVHEMMDFLADFYIDIIEKTLKVTSIDYYIFWEDMAYKTGPLISPKQFDEFMVPCYQKVTGVLRDYDVDVIMVDSDGNIDSLIPLWLKGGVNTFYPLEVQSGMDPVALRKEYGRKIRLIGGIDKRVFARDEESIEREVESKVPYLVSKGGYIPTPDHSIPPDVCLSNFQYYLKLVRNIVEN